MSQVSACFIEASKRVAAWPDISMAISRSTFAGHALVHLREDEPDPSGGLWFAAALADGGKDAVEDVVLILSLDEAVKVEGIEVRIGFGSE